MKQNLLGKTGALVSKIGFGASPLGGVFGKVEDAESVRTVHAAIDLGINFFDTAPYYGLTRSETALGKGLFGIAREKYFLASKVGRYNSNEFDFSEDRILRSIEESLKRLQTDSIDLITCHDIEFVDLNIIVNEAIPALRKAKEQGKIRFIGISGLPLSIYPGVMDYAEIDTALSYCHYCLNDVSLTETIPYLKSKEVGIINASPFAMGLLRGGDLPDWHPAPSIVRETCKKAFDFCKSKGAELPKLALQFTVSNPEIATTLVGMCTRSELEQNLGWISEPIDEALLNEVLQILQPVHNRTWKSGL